MDEARYLAFIHDARGNLAGEARPGGVSVTAGYDGFGRLTSYVQSGQPALAMTYNGHDERVTLTRGTAAIRRFIHDPDGRVIGEYTGGPTTPIAGAEGVAQQQYIWLLPETGDAGETGGDDGLGGWHPLAVVTADGAGGSPTLLWLHGNHLGVPQLATNAAGTSVAMTGFTLPGFPGQLQTLPDLYYNQHRDYDPTTGRYIQADPIGLAGDANPYLYAGASPMRLVDPEGLCIALAAATRATRATAICQNADGLYLSRRGAEAIIEEEGGVRRLVYLDSADIPTVGIGHRVLPQDRLRVGQVCQTDRITGWFVHDVRIAEAFVRTLVGEMPVSQEEFDALVDLTFNVGQGNLSRSRSPGLHRAIRNGSYSQVARQLRYTRDASGRSPSGLLRRSQRRENIFRRGDYRAPRP